MPADATNRKAGAHCKAVPAASPPSGQSLELDKQSQDRAEPYGIRQPSSEVLHTV